MVMQFDVNNSPTTGAEAVYLLKALLKQVGWVVKKSSDGTSLGADDTDTITSFGTGAGGMARSNAWFRIQDPGGTREFLFQRGTDNTSWKIRYSAAAKFTGGVATASTPNTATDEAYVMGSSGAFAAWNSTDGSYRWQGAADDVTPYGFYSIGHTAGATDASGGVTFSTVLIMDPLTDTNAADTDPVVIICALASSTTFDVSSFASASAPSSGWVRYGLSGAGFVVQQGLKFSFSSVNIFPNGASMNPFTLSDLTVPVTYARPVSQVNLSGYKGISTFLRWNGIKRSHDSVLSAEATYDRIVFGDLNFPWYGGRILA